MGGSWFSKEILISQTFFGASPPHYGNLWARYLWKKFHLVRGSRSWLSVGLWK